MVFVSMKLSSRSLLKQVFNSSRNVILGVRGLELFRMTKITKQIKHKFDIQINHKKRIFKKKFFPAKNIRREDEMNGNRLLNS